jgi:predicted NAD/FAD-binding protein
VDVAGYLLTVHVLDNGQRVYEDTPELRRLLSDLGVRPTVPPQGEERGA